MSVIRFSQELRERTRSAPAAADGADFMNDLVTGKGTREDYVALVAQHYFVYAALEAAAARFVDDPVASRFLTPQLTRLPAIEADLAFLIGDDWSDSIAPLPTTRAYVERIDQVSAERWAGGLVAHHYTRYLGDLSGGQAIRALMQRQFGFETNGVGFYLFDQIARPREFKNFYREQLDAAGWDAAESERVIGEVARAYALTTALFVDLARAKAAA